MRAFRLAALVGSFLLACGEERRLRGDSSRTLTNSTNDQAHAITRQVQLCEKKEETDCGIWNSVFHEDSFDCAEYTFAAAYDVCKGLDRHDYCGCADDSELLEWVDKFLAERRTKNLARYYGRPYPPPKQVGSSFLEFALCIKDEDPKGLLCRNCEFWNLKHMAVACNGTSATDDYCGCQENALLEYYDALAKSKTTVYEYNTQQQVKARPTKAPKPDAHSETKTSDRDGDKAAAGESKD